MSWNLSQDLAVAGIAAAASLSASWQYTRTRTDANRETVAVLRENVDALGIQRKLDAEFHSTQVDELNRRLTAVQAESRVLQNQAVDRLVALVADAIASQTREVLVDIRNHLQAIDSTTRTIRRGLGTRTAERSGDLAGDPEA